MQQPLFLPHETACIHQVNYNLKWNVPQHIVCKQVALGAIGSRYQISEIFITLNKMLVMQYYRLLDDD